MAHCARVLPPADRQLSAEPVPRRRQARPRRHLPRRGLAESQVLAINEFREFLSFYPTHPRADYAQYKLGMAHFHQMRAPQRDQTETREAVAELRTIVQQYPNSPLKPEAET